MHFLGSKPNKPSDLVFTTALPALTGWFVERAGTNAAKESLTGVKVPIACVTTEFYAWGNNAESLETVGPILKRAVGDDVLVSASDIAALVATAKPHEATTIKHMQARILPDARTQTMATPEEQAIGHAKKRQAAEAAAVNNMIEAARNGFYDVCALGTLKQQLATPSRHTQALTALAEAFPDCAVITGAVAAMNGASSGLMASLEGRIAALPNAASRIASCGRDAQAIPFAERPTIEARAAAAIRAGWRFGSTLWPSSTAASEIAPEKMLIQLAERGEIFVSHPLYEPTPKPLYSVAEFLDFLKAQTGA